MDVVLATSNPGKAHEAQAILGAEGVRIEVVPIWLGDVETGVTFDENALLKASAVMRMVRRPVLAEDAGLEVNVLGGLPGVRSARFAGPGATDTDNAAKLLRLLEGADDRSARYRSVAVLLFPTGVSVRGEGSWSGRIALEPRGTGGFGYDPIFVPEGQDRTAAEMAAEEKNAISHRARALHMLINALGAS